MECQLVKTMQGRTEELTKAIKAACDARGLTFGAAESCTGGLIGGAVTSLPGVSSCFKGGIVSYSNEVKHSLLGVSKSTLATAGAVSAECAREMASGACRALECDFAVAVTGIAGPDGGTPGKPVGLVYIATARRCGGASASRHVFQGGRAQVRAATVETALALLLGEIEGCG